MVEFSPEPLSLQYVNTTETIWTYTMCYRANSFDTSESILALISGFFITEIIITLALIPTVTISTCSGVYNRPGT